MSPPASKPTLNPVSRALGRALAGTFLPLRGYPLPAGRHCRLAVATFAPGR